MRHRNNFAPSRALLIATAPGARLALTGCPGGDVTSTGTDGDESSGGDDTTAPMTMAKTVPARASWVATSPAPIMPRDEDAFEDVVPVELPPDPEADETGERETPKAALAQLARLAGGLSSVIEAGLAHWADAERAALGWEDLDEFETTVRHGVWPHAKLIMQAPAALMCAARDGPGKLSESLIIEAFAEHVREQYVLREIPGSRWARGSGCGVQIEGEASRHFGCGMGHVPPLSRRFLHFFTDSGR